MGFAVRFEHDAHGIGLLLGSQEMRDHIQGRAERVAAQVSSETILPVFCEDHSSWNRARYRIGIDDPAAKRMEAKDRILGRAMDAAR